MMGERDPQAPIWSYRVNLDKRVRSDHPLRRINEVLDLSFVRGQVAHTYGRRGNKSVPPEVILRMMILLFLEAIGDQEKTGAIPTSHRMSPASLVAEATASRAIPRSKHGLDLA
jgi:hypothetical protein